MLFKEGRRNNSSIAVLWNVTGKVKDEAIALGIGRKKFTLIYCVSRICNDMLFPDHSQQPTSSLWVRYVSSWRRYYGNEYSLFHCFHSVVLSLPHREVKKTCLNLRWPKWGRPQPRVRVLSQSQIMAWLPLLLVCHRRDKHREDVRSLSIRIMPVLLIASLFCSFFPVLIAGGTDWYVHTKNTSESIVEGARANLFL